MMRMTYTSFMQFYENVDMSMIRGIWSPWRNEKGATAARKKWCHGNIPVPVTHGDTGAKGSERMRVVQGWWGDPDYRVSHRIVAWKRGTCTKQTGTVQTYRTSHTTHAFDHDRSSWGYTFEACVWGGTSSERCRGSRRSRDVVEVVVHGVGRGSSRTRRRR